MIKWMIILSSCSVFIWLISLPKIWISTKHCGLRHKKSFTTNDGSIWHWWIVDSSTSYFFHNLCFPILYIFFLVLPWKNGPFQDKWNCILCTDMATLCCIGFTAVTHPIARNKLIIHLSHQYQHAHLYYNLGNRAWHLSYTCFCFLMSLVILGSLEPFFTVNFLS